MRSRAVLECAVAAAFWALYSSLCIEAQNDFGSSEMSRKYERQLTEIDLDYFAPGKPAPPLQRGMCSGFGQVEPLKGEWASHRFIAQLSRTMHVAPTQIWALLG